MGGKMSFRRSSKIAVLLLLSCLGISACRQIERPFVPDPVCPKPLNLNVDLCPEPHICTDVEKCRLIERLEMHRVQVNHVGEDFRIVIPSDDLFRPKSANFNQDYLFVLGHIATLIHCYTKVDIRVAGYTDCWGCADLNRQLSTLQAQMVAKYLWRRGIDTRLIYAKGFGAKHPVASNCTYYSRARNRRIEITFRDFPNPKAIRGEMVHDMTKPACPKQSQ